MVSKVYISVADTERDGQEAEKSQVLRVTHGGQQADIFQKLEGNFRTQWKNGESCVTSLGNKPENSTHKTFCGKALDNPTHFCKAYEQFATNSIHDPGSMCATYFPCFCYISHIAGYL